MRGGRRAVEELGGVLGGELGGKLGGELGEELGGKLRIVETRGDKKEKCGETQPLDRASVDFACGRDQPMYEVSR